MAWKFLSTIRRSVEPWYTGYALQAVVVFGTGGILMPILINDRHPGNAALAGTIMAMFYVGQLISPLMGSLTDRTGKHRLFYLAGFVLLAVGLGLFPTTSVTWFWMALALLQGVGSGTSNTVATMFIVEFRPKDQWDSRIGWLQTFYGVGQCLGLVLVSYLQQTPAVGLYVSAVLMAPALVLGALKLPKPKQHGKPAAGSVHFHHRHHRPQRAAVSPVVGYHAALGQVLARLKKDGCSTFGLFIAGWFFIMLATWLLGILFPLLMKEALGLSYRLSSLYYGIGAFIGIFAYAPSGTLGEKIGDGWVVMIGAVMSVVALTGMAVMAYVDTGINAWLLPPVYMLIPIAWSPLMVGGNAWTAQLATGPEGEALGSFNAALAISSVLAAFGSGLIAHHFGYKMLLVFAAASSVVAVLIFLPLLGRAGKADQGQAPSADEPG
jgi:MFS transporter, DHA1 family, tetracycline resistance protein